MLSICALCACLSSARADWWPFGGKGDTPRLSELMEPASLLIDEASDLASEGKVSESVEKYRAALHELDLVEEKYPDLVDKPEFSTLKTKRAFVSASIDSILLSQARQNARAVATTDTTGLEKRLAEERGAKEKPVPSPDQVVAPPAPAVTAAEPVRFGQTPREQAMKAIVERNYAAADGLIADMLAANPKSTVALNLRAASESAQGRFTEAERTLDQAIESNPHDYFAYYNMAQLYLQTRPGDRSAARRYYETGRIYGGPKDPAMEAAFR